MKKLIFAILVSLLISGCAAPRPMNFTHPTKDASEFERDKYACERQSTEYVRSMGFMTQNFGPNPLMVRDETVKCLRLEKGWN